LALLLAMACVNAWNFMDGINGLAASQALLVVGFGLLWGLPLDVTPALAVLAAVSLGFLPWNAPRARLFLGDSGSHLLGVGVATVLLAPAPPGPGLWVGVALVSAFAVDTALTVLWRRRRGQPLGQAHREHLYQWAVRAGYSHRRVTMLYATWTAWLGAGMVLGRDNLGADWAATLLALAVGGLVWWRVRRWLQPQLEAA
jgi:UDP-N-acetylmuramyl pentapeptide phosphotransferase/UDP-N-acetylglucosamine-1-phosphate transferase